MASLDQLVFLPSSITASTDNPLSPNQLECEKSMLCRWGEKQQTFSLVITIGDLKYISWEGFKDKIMLYNHRF